MLLFISICSIHAFSQNPYHSPYKRTAQTDSFNAKPTDIITYPKHHRHHKHHRHRKRKNVYLSDVSKANSAKANIVTKDNNIKLWWIIPIVAFIILLRFTWEIASKTILKARQRKKYERMRIEMEYHNMITNECEACKRNRAMIYIDKTYIEKKPSTILEKNEQKDKKGNTIGTFEHSVPATTYLYREHWKCRYCGKDEYRVSIRQYKD